MPISSDIYGQLQQPAAFNPLAELATVQHLKALQNQNQLAALGFQDRQQAQSDQQTLRNALLGLGSNATDDQRINALKGTGLQAGFQQADTLQSSMLTRQKTGSEVSKNQAEAAFKQAETRAKLAEQHAQELAYVRTPEDVMAYAKYGEDNGLFQPGAAQRAMSKLQELGGNVEAFKQMAAQAAVPQVEQFKQQEEMARTKLQTDTQLKTNAATNQSHLQGIGIQQAGENSRSAANRQQALNLANRGVIHDTDAGTMLIDPRTAGAQPIVNPATGQPLGKPLKDIPASVNTAIVANTQSATKLQQAIDLLSGKNVGDPAKGGMTGDASATGFKGYLPNGLLNQPWVDPKGVDARAAVADIGSLKIHDRSGAAVTVSESPRLMPFVPTATDDNATVLKKLRRLQAEVGSESQALADTYSKDQGYKPNPVLARAVAGGTAAATGARPPLASFNR